MDYDSALNKSTTVMSLAGIFPLFFKIATNEQAHHVHEHITKSFLKRGA
jgi:alpha,alpha-trehalase